MSIIALNITSTITFRFNTIKAKNANTPVPLEAHTLKYLETYLFLQICCGMYCANNFILLEIAFICFEVGHLPIIHCAILTYIILLIIIKLRVKELVMVYLYLYLFFLLHTLLFLPPRLFLSSFKISFLDDYFL